MNEHFILSITARQQRLVSRQSGYLPNITTIFRRVNRLERQPNLELLLDIDHTLELSHHLHLIPHPDFYRYRVPYFPLPLFITPLVFARENPKQSCAAFDIPPKNKMDGLITVKRYYRTTNPPQKYHTPSLQLTTSTRRLSTSSSGASANPTELRPVDRLDSREPMLLRPVPVETVNDFLPPGPTRLPIPLALISASSSSTNTPLRM